MPIDPYGVLVGRAVRGETERDDPVSPHYRLYVAVGAVEHRVLVTVKSARACGVGAQLLHLADEQFRHPLLARIKALAPGFHRAARVPEGLALDYVRGGLLDRRAMRRLPYDAPGDGDDLNDRLDTYVRLAISEPAARVFAWGEAFPGGRGLHNVHMNQGNPRHGPFGGDNGVWQDGALFFHLPDEGRWIAVFLAFQTQAWRTDDLTGHPIADLPTPRTGGSASNLPFPARPGSRRARRR
jgi:uncharacterized protein YukJ